MVDNVIITGATGLLGRQVLRAFDNVNWHVTGVGFNRASMPMLKIDLANSDDVAEMIVNLKPSIVIHCAANRFPDQCDNDKEGTYNFNVTASSNLALICAVHDIFFVFISTDYVFSGRLGEAPYEIDSKPDPTNFYGETKLRGEEAVLKAYERAGKKGWAVILRVPVLYGETLSNRESAVNVLMDSLWETQMQKKTIQMDHWSIRYPTNTKDVARVCQDVVSKYVSTKRKFLLPNILHFSSEEGFTKYEICQVFSKIVNLSIDNIKPDIKGSESSGTIRRPYNCHLSTRALKDLGIDISTVDFEKWWRYEAKSLMN